MNIILRFTAFSIDEFPEQRQRSPVWFMYFHVDFIRSPASSQVYIQSKLIPMRSYEKSIFSTVTFVTPSYRTLLMVFPICISNKLHHPRAYQ